MSKKPEKSKKSNAREESDKAEPEKKVALSPLDHPLVPPLLFSFLFSLLFALLFSLLLLPEEKPEPRKSPALAARCLGELKQPFMLEKDATRLTCTRDGTSGIIVSYGYRPQDIGKEWISPNQKTLTLYRGEDGLYCINKTCLRAKFKEDGSYGKIIKKN